MKNLTKSFILIALLLTFGVGQLWAGDNCDFRGEVSIRLTVNGVDTKIGDLPGNGQSDMSLGTVSDLTLTQVRALTWKKSDGNVCNVTMHYGLNTSRDGSKDETAQAQWSNDGYDDWWDGDKNVQQFKSSFDVDLLDGLTPGTTYYLDFYFSIEGNSGGSTGCHTGQKYWSNNGGNYHVSFTVADAKTTFETGKYIYIDARDNGDWKAANFTARFFFKRYDTGDDISNVTCLSTEKLEDWVYYAQVPSGSYNGKLQVDRLNPSNLSDQWCTTTVKAASERSTGAENCLYKNENYCKPWDPSWTTYCPPMSSVTLADNGTTTWGGNGGSSTPYLVPTGGDIKVHVTASASALDDANMTKYFLFKKAGSAVGSGSSSTEKTITASGTTGTKEAVIVEAYNYYNSTEGTHLASSAIYYEARTPYTISYNKGTYGTGSRASETKLKGVNFTLPGSAVFERTGYTQTGWTTSDGGTQTHALGGSYTSDVAQEFFPVWTANEYTVTLNNLEATSAGTESVTATYDATLSAITKPAKTHYDFGGYWTSSNGGSTLTTQLIDANGNWIKNVSTYTGASEDDATWIYADNITLYAKWTEHEYDITIEVTGSGSTSPASSTKAKYVTASGDITATPSTGYSFQDWDFSKTGEDNDVYSAGGYSSVSNPIHILAQHDGTLTANFTANSYTVTFENLGADTGHKGSLDTTVTYDASTNMTDPIEVPSKAHYDFGGYYISTNKGSTLTTQLIDADGNWIKDVSGYTGHSGDNPTWVCAGDTTLYAKWTETAYTITPSVTPAGAGSVNTVTDAHLITPSSTITATPANAAWIFDYWEYGTHVGKAGGDGNAITVTSDMNSTITAHFKPRYELVGDIYDGSGNGGMPGWAYDGTGEFTYNSFTALGTGEGKGCDLSCSRTLNANTTYRFQIHDRVTGNHGYATAATYIGDGDHLLFNTKDQNVMLAAIGAGTYTFRITNITEGVGDFYPTLIVERPHEVNFGQKYQDIDGTLHSGTTGGTASASASGALSSGDYVTYNTSVTHTATPASGYTFAGWWGSDAFEGDAFTDYNPWCNTVTSGDNAYAKFTEDSKSVTISKTGNGTITVGGSNFTWGNTTTCGVTTTRRLVATGDPGYRLSSWTVPDGVNFQLEDKASDTDNDVTLRGKASGSAGTLTANFTERYSIKGTMNGEDWGTTHTLTNIGTNAGSKDTAYVTMTLPANTTYEFAIYDEQTGNWLKNSTTEVFNMTYTNHTNWGFGTDKTVNCGITTAGKGSYKFIFNITDKTVTVIYPNSYQVNYGTSPSIGGSVTAVDGDENAVPNGGYVVAGGSVTYTAAAASGYTFVGWCNNDSYGEPFNYEDSWTHSSVAATSNSYAKFKSTNFVIYRTGDKAEDPRAAYDDVESYAGGTISEKIEYRMKVRELDKWYSLCLPFALDSVGVWDESAGVYYDLVPYYRAEVGATLQGGHYIIRTPKQTSDLLISEFDDWRDPTSPTSFLPAKNTPYIIMWHMSYFDGKYVSFFGKSGQAIPTSMSAGSAPSSDNVVNVCVNDAMTTGYVQGAYVLDSDYGEGAWLRGEKATDNTTVLPFECFIRASSKATGK